MGLTIKMRPPERKEEGPPKLLTPQQLLDRYIGWSIAETTLPRLERKTDRGLGYRTDK